MELNKYYNKYELDLKNKYTKSIYHYTDIESFKKIIQNNCLRFSNRYYQNDYSEGKFTIDLCLENIDTLCPNDKKYKNIFIELCKVEKEKLKNNFFNTFICCFSTDGDGLMLWNYYAQNGGINLKFNNFAITNCMKNKLIENKTNSKIFQCGKVIYDKKRQLEIIKKIIDDFYEENEDKNLDNCIKLAFKKILFASVFFKHTAMQNEREYRIAFELGALNGEVLQIKEEKYPIKLDFRNAHGLIIPFVDIKFDPACLIGICFSPISCINSKTLKSYLPKEYEIDKIKIKKSEIPLRW